MAIFVLILNIYMKYIVLYSEQAYFSVNELKLLFICQGLGMSCPKYRNTKIHFLFGKYKNVHDFQRTKLSKKHCFEQSW